MNFLRLPLLTALMGLAALTAPLSTIARGQEIKPIAILSVASVDEILADATYVTTIAEMPDAGKTVRLFGNALTTGMDKKRPSGLYVVPKDGDFHAIAFIPVTDLKQLLNIHKEYLGEPSDEGDGILKTQIEDRTIYIKEQNGWAFMAEEKEQLSGLPQDPAALLGTMPKDYNLGVKVLIKNIPEDLREMAISEIKFGLERGLNAPGLQGQDIDRDAIEQIAKNSLGNIEKFLNEADEISIGLAVDATAKSIYIDINVLAKEGTDLAKGLAMQAEAKSNFAGFVLPNAAVSLNVTAKMTQDEISQTTAAIQQMKQQLGKKIDDDPNLPQEQRGVAKELLGQLFGVLEKTIAGGKMDAGAVVTLEPNAINVAAGIHVVDGAVLEQSLKRIVELAKGQPDFPDVKLNAGTHAGVQLHKIAVPIPEEQGDVREFFGENLDITIGTGGSAFYIAVGKNGESLLKEVIDKSASASSQTVPPTQVTVSLLPIMKFFAAQKEDDPKLAEITKKLEQAGHDKISIVGKVIPRGSSTRIEVQEGVLKLIGDAIRAAGGLEDLNL